MIDKKIIICSLLNCDEPVKKGLTKKGTPYKFCEPHYNSCANRNNKEKSLLPRHIVFIKEFIISLNQTEAYMKVFKCSRRIANINSAKLMKKASIKAEVHKQLQKSFNKLDITKEEVLNRLTRVARSSMGTFAKWNGEEVILSSSESLTDEQKAMISEVCQTKHGVKIKLRDRDKADELLGKYFVLFTDKVEHSGEIKTKGLKEEALEAGYEDVRDYIREIIIGEKK